MEESNVSKNKGIRSKNVFLLIRLTIRKYVSLNAVQENIPLIELFEDEIILIFILYGDEITRNSKTFTFTLCFTKSQTERFMTKFVTKIITWNRKIKQVFVKKNSGGFGGSQQLWCV